jgi:ankyrin repeat protein
MSFTRAGGSLAAVVVAVAGLAAPSPAQADQPVLAAVRSGDTGRLRALLKARADANATETDGTSALHWAVQRDDVEAVGLLIQAGADVKVANRYGITPLLVACTNGTSAIVEKLLQAGADPNTTSPEGETALMTAARTGRVETVKMLLARGAKVDAREQWRGQTALMWAAAENHPETVTALIEAGADVNARSNGGFTALLFAVRAGSLAATRALVALGAHVNDAIQSTPPRTPAGAAARGEPSSGVAAGRPGPPPPGVPPGAASQNNLAQLLQAFNTGSRGRTGPGGTSALVLAITNAHFELASVLLDLGADPNAAGQGWTPLHQVAWTRRPPIQHGLPPAVQTGNLSSLALAEKLLQHGADPNARMTREPSDGARNVLNRIGSTPFLQAAKLADVPLMRLLVAYGADPSITTEEGATPLMAAAGVGIWQLGESAGLNEEAFEAVKLCVELGNDVNAVDANGNTALHGAAHRGSNDIVRLLVEKGAKLDVVNSLGWTPWIIADGVFYPNTYNRRLHTAELLAKLGADTKAGKRRPEDLPPSEAQATSSTAAPQR